MTLPTASPSSAGIDARGVLDLLDAADHLDLHSLAIARDGRAVARGWWQPYGSQRRHLLYSVSKSLTATTIATLVRDGVLGLDDPVLDHLPAVEEFEVAEVWHRVTVRHCLTMTVGHTAEAWPGAAAIGAEPLLTILSNPPDAEPGSVFCYNQVATYLLSRAAEHRTGTPLDRLAHDRVLAPLGGGDLEWERDRAGHVLGFTGARLRTDDLLALTQLWLDGGRWQGRDLLPPGWVEEASRPFLAVTTDSDSDWEHGYGQSFWVARHGFRADGAFGQYGLVLPEQRLTVAVTSELTDMQELLDLVWTHLLPAVDRPGGDAADAALEERLAALRIEPLQGDAAAPEVRTFAVREDSDLGAAYTGVTVSPDGDRLTLVRAGAEIDVAVGDGTWADGELVADGRHVPVAASGGWTAEGYRAQVRVVETPHTVDIATGAEGALLRWRLAPLRGRDPFESAVR